MSKHISYNPSLDSQMIFNARNSVFLDLMKKLNVSKDVAILDVGCGRGDMLKLLKKNSYQNLYGIDIDPTLVTLSSEFAAVYQGSADRLEVLFPDQTFDVVICSHVLEHVKSPYHVLKAIGRTASDVIILAVPNSMSFGNIIKQLLQKIPPVNRGHLQLWDTAHFLNLIETAELHCLMNPVTEYFSVFPYRLINTVFGRRMTLFLRRIDFVGFCLMPKILPRLGISIICVCRNRRGA